LYQNAANGKLPSDDPRNMKTITLLTDFGLQDWFVGVKLRKNDA